MFDAELLVQRYEDLRREVMANEVDSPLGLSVLLRRGLVGWMQVQSFLTATAKPPTPRPCQALTPLPKGLAGELTKILTQLIVNRKELHA